MLTGAHVPSAFWLSRIAPHAWWGGLQLAAVRAVAPYLLIDNPILGFLRTFSLLQLLFRGQHQPEH